jgi:hypothetical protein
MMSGFQCSLLRAGLLVFGMTIALAALPGRAQIIQLQGGDSTLFQAQGGSVEVKGPNYSGSLGAGFFQGRFQTGAQLRTQLAGYKFTAGDDLVRFDLPTDIFDSDFYFSARGLGIARGDKDQSIYVFGGVTSNWMGTGFFQAAQSADPAGIVFFHRRLSNTLQFYSRGIFSTHNTSLQALEWQPDKWLKIASTGGIGSGKAYFASSFDAELRKWKVRASYVQASTEFRRVTVPSILNSEADRENVEVAYQPNSNFALSAAHRNLLQPVTVDSPLAQSTVNSVSGSFNIRGTFFGVGLFASSADSRDTRGANFYAGHRVRDRVEVTANYFDSRTSDGQSDAMISGMFREIITPRFNLLQLVTRSNGQTTLAYGGEFLTNRFSLRADYQNVYLPLRPDHPFQQALALNASVRIIGPVQITAASNVAPDGRVRYTFGGTTYLYRYKGLAPWQTHPPETYSFPKYLVRGTVRDEDGNPVAGAALRINGEIVYTDDAGHFLLRLRKRGEVKLEVAWDEFLTPGVFETVNMPKNIAAEPEGQAQEVEISIRRRRTAPIELRQFTPGTTSGNSTENKEKM